jgi:hypothetical protein
MTDNNKDDTITGLVTCVECGDGMVRLEIVLNINPEGGTGRWASNVCGRTLILSKEAIND